MRTIEVTQSGQTFRMQVEAVLFVDHCLYVGRTGEHEFKTPDYRQKFCHEQHKCNFYAAKAPEKPHPVQFPATARHR